MNAHANGVAVAWNEGSIGRVLARKTFAGSLCVLPNCTWTGNEIDLLVVTPTLRVVDVEIKISRADLARDREKSKWWQYPPWTGTGERPPRQPRPWPVWTWKHYYAMPKELWRDDYVALLQPISGVLLVRKHGVECIRRARAHADAKTLTQEQVVGIARLASLRMWDAYAAFDTKAQAEAAS